MTRWKGVPLELDREWRAAFGERSNGVRLATSCPICGERSLCRYWGSASTQGASPGFAGRGALWEWCSSCCSYEHYSGLVPEWWQAIPLSTEHRFTAEPEEVEQSLRLQKLL